MTRSVLPVVLAVLAVSPVLAQDLSEREAPANPLAALAAEAEADGLSTPDAHALTEAVQARIATGTTAEEAILRASNAGASDQLGLSVSLDGDRALVGAFSEDGATGTIRDGGAAYVFDFDGTSWTETAVLRASNAGRNDYFGFSVSLDGDRALIGTRFEGGPADGTPGAGAAYVFDFDGTSWTETTILRASSADADDEFGFSVSLDGDRALVGSRLDDGPANGVPEAGAVYVYDLAGGTWTETAILRLANPAGGSRPKAFASLDGVQFGYTVSLDGDRALIGSRFEVRQPDGSFGTGAAYIFDLAGGTWSQTARLEASNPGLSDRFGETVSLDGDRALIGASREDGPTDGDPDAGAAYVFELSGGTWTQTALLRADNANSGDQFGETVSLDGDRALIGAFQEDGPTNASVTNAGAAYVFDLAGGVWTQTAILRASNAGIADIFGESVSLDGDRVLIGAPEEDGVADATSRSGAAYVIRLDALTTTLVGAEGYRMLAHPLGDSVDDLIGSIYTQGFPGSNEPSRSFCSVYTFDETTGTFTGGYTCVGDASDAIPRGTGVFAYVYGDDPVFRPTETEDGLPQTLVVAGTAADAPFSTFPLTYTDGATTPAFQEGWTLLGNPFADGFDWDLVTRSASLLETIYVYDPNYLGGDFRSWTQGIGGDLTDGIVPAFQGFFAKSNAAGATLTIPTGAVVSPTPTVYGRGGTEAGTPDPLRLGLSVQGEGVGSHEVSAMFVTTTDGAALGEDTSDAYRLTPGAWPRTVLSTLTEAADGEAVPLVLNALPADAEGEVTVPVSVTAEGHEAGPLELVVSASGTLPEGWTAVLVDRETGIRTEVTPGMDYRFTIEVTEASAKAGTSRLGVSVGPFASRARSTAYDSGDRFSLVVTPARVETAPDAFVLGTVAPNPTRGTAEVALTLPEAGEVTVSVFDAMGRSVGSMRQTAMAGRQALAVPVSGLAPGVYVVRVETPNGAATKRLTVVR